MEIALRKFEDNDISQAIKIWNDVVREGISFPQIDALDEASGLDFFNSQSHTGVAVTENNDIVGIYILHPNNVGRCGHICNASFAVKNDFRGYHIGEMLVRDCMEIAKQIGFKILQFNAVVEKNIVALNLYKKLGFKQLGVIPNGFLSKNGELENIIPHYIEL